MLNWLHLIETIGERKGKKYVLARSPRQGRRWARARVMRVDGLAISRFDLAGV